MKREQRRGHIFLIGFMGAGKSSVSAELAKIAELPLIDLDSVIEAQAGCSINEIFAEEGEAGFRNRETRALEALRKGDRHVVSCGGGIVCSGYNRSLLHELGEVIYLQAPIATILKRIAGSTQRPMLAQSRCVDELFFEREGFYIEAADITIETSERSVPEVAAACKAALDERGLL